MAHAVEHNCNSCLNQPCMSDAGGKQPSGPSVPPIVKALAKGLSLEDAAHCMRLAAWVGYRLRYRCQSRALHGDSLRQQDGAESRRQYAQLKQHLVLRT